MITKNGGLILRGDTWHMRFTLKGILVAESTHTSVRREAEQILAKRRTDLLQQVMLGKAKSIKLHEAINHFQSLKARLPSTRTVNVSTNLFKVIPNVNFHDVTRIQSNAVIEARFAAGKAKSTVQNAVLYWNAMINYYEELGYAVPKPLPGIKGIQGRVRWLTDDEEKALFAALHPSAKIRAAGPTMIAQRTENYELAIMLRHTGARLAEIANMKWSQVDFGRKTVLIRRGKGSKDSTIHMSNVLHEMLVARKARSDSALDNILARASKASVFPTKDANTNGAHWIKKAVKRASISEEHGKVSLHTLRHTAATKWLQGGMNLVEVQKQLGHKNIASTMVYQHVMEEDASMKAAAIMNARTPETA